MASRLSRQVTILENSVRFYNKFTLQDFLKMDYENVYFQGMHIIDEKQKEQKERLRSAAFISWNLLSIHAGDKAPSWIKYLKDLGIHEDEDQISKEDLKREADQAMEKVNNIIARAKKAKKCQ